MTATPSTTTVIYSSIQSTKKTKFHIFTNPFKSSSSVKFNSFAIKCSDPINNNGGLKNLLPGIVDERVNELLNKEENRVLLDGLDKATQRVELAKRELEEIKKQEFENNKIKEYINQLEIRAAEVSYVFFCSLFF